MQLKLNVGPIDSIIRILVGVTLLFLALMGIIGSWGFLGVIMIATGLARNCPIYGVCSLDTNKAEHRNPNASH